MKTENFHFVGNNKAIDFINTVVGLDAQEVDLLDSPEALTAWLKAAGYRLDETISIQTYEKAKTLRAAIKKLIMTASVDLEDLHEARHILNNWLKLIQHHRALVMIEGEYEFERNELPKIAAYYLADIAEAAAILLVETPADRIRECAHSSCVLKFKDTSKSGRRKWCSMDICGNRAKVATHYKRHAV